MKFYTKYSNPTGKSYSSPITVHLLSCMKAHADTIRSPSTKSFLKMLDKRLPGGPGVSNLPCNAGDSCPIPGGGIKISPASEQLSFCAATTEPTALPAVCHHGRAHVT